MKISFRYESFTEESLENVNCFDCGFLDKNYTGGLKAALNKAISLGCSEPSYDPVPKNIKSIYFTSVDPDINLYTGEEKYYSIHISGIGERTLSRICRAFGVKMN